MHALTYSLALYLSFGHPTLPLPFSLPRPSHTRYCICISSCRAMEAGLNAHGTNPLIAPIHFPSELERTDSLKRDLDFFFGEGWEQRPECKPSVGDPVCLPTPLCPSIPVVFARAFLSFAMSDFLSPSPLSTLHSPLSRFSSPSALPGCHRRVHYSPRSSGRQHPRAPGRPRLHPLSRRPERGTDSQAGGDQGDGPPACPWL